MSDRRGNGHHQMDERGMGRTDTRDVQTTVGSGVASRPARNEQPRDSSRDNLNGGWRYDPAAPANNQRPPSNSPEGSYRAPAQDGYNERSNLGPIDNTTNWKHPSFQGPDNGGYPEDVIRQHPTPGVQSTGEGTDGGFPNVAGGTRVNTF